MRRRRGRRGTCRRRTRRDRRAPDGRGRSRRRGARRVADQGLSSPSEPLLYSSLRRRRRGAAAARTRPRRSACRSGVLDEEEEQGLAKNSFASPRRTAQRRMAAWASIARTATASGESSWSEIARSTGDARFPDSRNASAPQSNKASTASFCKHRTAAVSGVSRWTEPASTWAAQAVQNVSHFPKALSVSLSSLAVAHTQRFQKLIRVGIPSVIISLQGLSKRVDACFLRHTCDLAQTL